MSKEFKKLLESELLTEDTKNQLQEAIETFKEEAITEAKKELEVEFAQKLVVEKEELTKKLYDLINEAVSEEIGELKEDIEHYKTLEPDYAKKLEEFKEEYSKKMTEGFNELVESQVKVEVKELEADLMEAKQNYFGLELFEAFRETYKRHGVESDVLKEMDAMREELATVKSALKESNETIAKKEREEIMEGLLQNLSGTKREVMKTILESVETSKLESRYEETIEAVIKEKEEKEEVKDDLNEGHEAEIKRLRALIGN